jgi:hypothetical protein
MAFSNSAGVGMAIPGMARSGNGQNASLQGAPFLPLNCKLLTYHLTEMAFSQGDMGLCC